MIWPKYIKDFSQLNKILMRIFFKNFQIILVREFFRKCFREKKFQKTNKSCGDEREREKLVRSNFKYFHFSIGILVINLKK